MVKTSTAVLVFVVVTFFLSWFIYYSLKPRPVVIVSPSEVTDIIGFQRQLELRLRPIFERSSGLIVETEPNDPQMKEFVAGFLKEMKLKPYASLERSLIDQPEPPPVRTPSELHFRFLYLPVADEEMHGTEGECRTLLYCSYLKNIRQARRKKMSAQSKIFAIEQHGHNQYVFFIHLPPSG